jgi:hypothetical protein
MTKEKAKIQPKFVCYPCGMIHGSRPRKPKQYWSDGECSICHIKGAVTVPETFGFIQPTWNHTERKPHN